MIKYTLYVLSIISLSATAVPTLEIANKSAQDISVKVERFLKGDTTKVDTSYFTIPGHDTKVANDVQIGDGLKLEISYFRDKARKMQRVYIKNSANNKTKYLTWNPDEYPKAPLYPQTGVFWGLGKFIGANQTKTGLSLENNVTRAEIEQRPAE